MNKVKEKILSLIIVSTLVLGIVGIVPFVSLAANTDLNVKCYTIKTGDTVVYSDSDLKNKSGVIYDTDELTLLSFTAKSARVKYPITGTNSKKTGFIKTSAILKTDDGQTKKSKAKVETYKRPNGDSYGFVAKGDIVQRLGTSGDYVQIMYKVSNGYKLAFLTDTGWKVLIGEITLTPLSKGLYKKSAASITCGFDGYTTTVGRHEGIDIAYKINAPIYSLTDGKVIRVHSGSVGSLGLSTIAIYNKKTNKTIIYLHSNPTIKEGATVKKGDKIGKESYRGITAITGAHTHVEVRNGKEKYAAISVGDSNLENSNPTGFWNSMRLS